MKRNFTVCAILAAAMILIPLITMQENKSTVPVNQKNVENLSDDYDGFISVMKTATGKIEEIPEKEYLVGVLAAEMDISAHEEALKAQVVAAYTYYLYCKETQSDSTALNGADISDSGEKHQAYLSADERKEKWGDNFSKNEEKAQKTVEEVLGKVILFEGKPIMAVYHDLNCGKTQSSQTVWKKDVAYLTEVESPGDKLSVNYSTSVSFSYDEFKKRMETIDGLTLNDDKENWVGDIEKNSDGYVETIEICSYKVSSADFRTVLDLNSCCFTVNCEDEKITFKTVGNGHMVGMSQYGADYMARQGSDYREILLHYYKGAEIQ